MKCSNLVGGRAYSFESLEEIKAELFGGWHKNALNTRFRRTKGCTNIFCETAAKTGSFLGDWEAKLDNPGKIRKEEYKGRTGRKEEK